MGGSWQIRTAVREMKKMGGVPNCFSVNSLLLNRIFGDLFVEREGTGANCLVEGL